MSIFRQVLEGVFGRLFPRKPRRTFNEQPTRPLDAEALARALTGEGRRHVLTGFARSILPGNSQPTSSLYTLMAKSDGLNALPDFGMIGVAESESTSFSPSNLGKIALSTFTHHMAQMAVLDFLDLEGLENSSSLQTIVVEAMNISDRVVQEIHPDMQYSLTAGLIFAEIIILGHHGNTRAYHIDRHHIERITPGEINPTGSTEASNSIGVGLEIPTTDENPGGEPAEVIVYSRPIPRDGYILLCTHGLWSNMSERDIHKIVVRREDPYETCQALVSQIIENDSQQELSVLLLYFPPDFGPWR